MPDTRPDIDPVSPDEIVPQPEPPQPQPVEPFPQPPEEARNPIPQWKILCPTRRRNYRQGPITCRRAATGPSLCHLCLLHCQLAMRKTRIAHHCAMTLRTGSSTQICRLNLGMIPIPESGRNYADRKSMPD